jgi:hypothetical protein
MNLKRLLTVGGSLESRKGAAGRYRMAPTGVLPKFELRGDTLTAVPMEGVVRSKSAPTKASPGPLFDAPVETVRTEETPSRPAVATDPVKEEPVAAAPNPFSAESARNMETTGFLKGLLDSIGSVFSDAFSGRKNRARRRAARATVQGELGLDAVRPLHNDLSGSDFEVVAVPVSKPGLKVRPTVAPKPETSPATSADKAPAEPRPDTRLLGAKD